MLNSKLDRDKFPCLPLDEISKYITWYANVDITLLDPVFIGRFAHMCKDLGIKGNINSGYRPTERQIELYKAVGGKLVNGEWTGGKPTVAKPTRSWHEYHLALDTDTLKIKIIDKEASTINQKTLMKYGLFKPLTKGNNTSIYEDWHIQPIETLNIKDKKSIEPSESMNFIETVKLGDKGSAVKYLQSKLVLKGYKLVVDGDFGNKTLEAVKDFQNKNGMVGDGIVGRMTWNKL